MTIIKQIIDIIKLNKLDILGYIILQIIQYIINQLPTFPMTPNPTDANYLYPKEQDIITRSTNVLCNFYITIIIIVILSIFKRKIEFLFYSILAYLLYE